LVLVRSSGSIVAQREKPRFAARLNLLTVKVSQAGGEPCLTQHSQGYASSQPKMQMAEQQLRPTLTVAALIVRRSVKK
jgi:hypothetical protein